MNSKNISLDCALNLFSCLRRRERESLQSSLIFFVLGILTGAAAIGFGATQHFGTVGSVGYISSMTCGGVITLGSMTGFILTAISRCKQTKTMVDAQINRSIQPLDRPPIRFLTNEDESTQEVDDQKQKEEAQTQKRLTETFLLHKEKAAKNDPIALYELAFCYATGRGVDKDDKHALELVQKSAGLGCEQAKQFLARLKQFYA